MSFILHQAIYGDKQGAYSLLDSSMDIETAKRICNVTDLLDRPNNGHLTKAIHRGFAFDDYYLFIKTFPDTDPNVRSGRVLSHALIVALKDFVLCNDLDYIFEQFMQVADKGHKVDSIVYSERQDNVAHTIKSNTRAACVINELIHSNNVLWLGEEDYSSTLRALWRGLPSTLRYKLKFGVAFDPKKINEEFINFNYLLEQDESKWLAFPYRIVKKNQVESINSVVAHYLSGDTNSAAELITTLDIFNIDVTSLEDLDTLVILSHTYSNLTKAQLNHLVSVCDLISKYCPNKKIASIEKFNVLSCLAERIRYASSKEISALQYVDWSGFDKVGPILNKAIASWFEDSLDKNGLQSTTDKIILSALSALPSTKWWVVSVISQLEIIFSDWKLDYAKTIWQWVLADPQLFNKLESYIPYSEKIENDLVQTWQKPSDILATLLQEFSQKRNWYDLHALSILCQYPATECIILQLTFDVDETHISAIEMIANNIDGDTLLSIALKLTDCRLIQLACQKIKMQSSLLNEFNISNPNWIRIGFECIKLDINIWQYIDNSKVLAYKLFDRVIDGLTVNQNVFTLLSESGLSDLSEYPQRSLIWKHIDSKVKNIFLNATAMSCIKLADQKIIRITNLEAELVSTICTDNFIKQIISDQSYSMSIKINLFERFEKLSENSCCMLIQLGEFSSDESSALGKIILNRQWKKAAELCKNLSSKQDRRDLNIATQKCTSLFEHDSLLSRLKERLNWTGSDLERLQDKQFQVSLSFPGEKREYVENITNCLLKHLGKNDVFYDNNFKHLISQPNADTILQTVYRHNSELIVVFLCSEYAEKQWCGLEWRAIRDIIKYKNERQIMPVRFDNQEIEGLFSIDGYIDANTHTEEQVAKLILHRLAVLLETTEKNFKG